MLKGVIPKGWRKFSFPKSVTVSAWLANLSQRMAQLQVGTVKIT